MGQRPPALLLILLAIGSGGLWVLLRETGATLLVEGFIESVAHSLGIEKAKLMAQLANLVLPISAMAACIYAAYRLGVNERNLGYAPHLYMPLYDAAKLAYGRVRKARGPSAGHIELLADKIDSIITWYCIALTMPRDDGMPLVFLYGCRLPSEQKERIAISKNEMVFVVRDDKVVLKDREGYGEYHNLLVRKSQVKKLSKQLLRGEAQMPPTCSSSDSLHRHSENVVIEMIVIAEGAKATKQSTLCAA